MSAEFFFKFFIDIAKCNAYSRHSGQKGGNVGPTVIEVSYIRTKYLKLPKIGPERQQALEQEAADLESGKQAPEPMNPFPQWVKDIIKKRLGCKAVFDHENKIYIITPKKDMDLDDIDDVVEKFNALYESEAKKDEERMKWRADHYCHAAVKTGGDETELLREVDAHLSGHTPETGSTPKAKPAKRGVA